MMEAKSTNETKYVDLFTKTNSSISEEAFYVKQEKTL